MLIFKNKYFQIFLIVALIVYLFIEAQGEGDFFIYSYASFNLSQGIDIYQAKYVGGFHYYYSVLFAYVLSLFNSLPFYGVKLVWLILNASLFFHLLYLLSKSNWLKVLTENERTYFLFFVFLFSFRFFHQNIHFAQITILVLWCCVYSLISIHEGKTFRGAAILALGINLKLLPLVFLPYLIYRGYWKAFVICISVYLFSLLVPSVLIGHSYNMQLLKSWYALINPSNTQHILDTDERSFHGLSTLLATLLVERPPDPYAMALKRNIADISTEKLSQILLLIRVCLIGLTLYFLKWPPFKKAATSSQFNFEIAYILLIIPLIFPHQQHYAFLFTVPAYSICLYYVFLRKNEMQKFKRLTLIFLLIFIYLTANLGVLMGEFNRYYEHYKLLTYGALMLIPFLISVSASFSKYTPSRISEQHHVS